MRISDWSSDVCSSDLTHIRARVATPLRVRQGGFGSGPHLCQSARSAIAEIIARISSHPHDARHARPVRVRAAPVARPTTAARTGAPAHRPEPASDRASPRCRRGRHPPPRHRRSEEHTSELQSLMRLSYAVFCLKNKKLKTIYTRQVTKTQST